MTVRDGAAGARVARDFDGTGVSGPGSDVGAGDEGDAVPHADGPDADGPDADDEDVGAGDEVAACPEPPEQPATTNAATAPATSAAVLPEPPVTT
jgi:hypothetical protein